MTQLWFEIGLTVVVVAIVVVCLPIVLKSWNRDEWDRRNR